MSATTHKRWEFDARGNMLWSHDGRGRTVYAYDAESRLAGAVYPDGSGTALCYDERGNPAGRHGPLGAERFAYDEQGRLLGADYPGGTALRYRYDDAGRLLRAEGPGCRTRYEYGAGQLPERMLQTVDGEESLTELRYDEHGRLTAARVPGFDSWLRYRYDERGRLAALGYDGAGELAQLSYADDSSQVDVRFTNGVTQRYALGAGGVVRRITVTGAGGEALLDLSYRSDPRAGVTAIGQERYRYDGRGRLVAHGPLLGVWARYEYDDAGNRLRALLPGDARVEYDYDAAGRLLGWRRSDGGAARYAYDAAGNLASREDGCGALRYRFDGAGRMVAASGAAEARYGYDHNGRRVLKRAGAERTVTHRDPWGRRLAERSGDETRVYLGPTGAPLVCLVVRAGAVTPLFLHADHLGSIRLATGMGGETAARFDYDPWGELAGGEGPEWLRIFAGHPFDSALGLYDAGVRLYDQEVGRFISADCYTFGADDPRLLWPCAPPEARRGLRAERLRSWQRSDALHGRYVYARNSPLTFVDPDGRDAGLYFLYTLAAIFWALPYTLVGFLLFELLFNWITFAFLWSGDYDLSGQSSDRLGAWAVWSAGGLSGKMVAGGGAFTLGNWVIANGPFFSGLDDTAATFAIPNRPGDLDPLDASALVTERRAVIEHELRHTNQYGWWGPFMMPWVLVFYAIVFFAVVSIDAGVKKQGFLERWGQILGPLTDRWWKVAIEGVALLLLPGAYWWDYIVRGGYGASAFEQDAALNSGASNSIDVRLASSADGVAPGGTAVISLVADPNLLGGASLTFATNASGGTLAEISATLPVTNVRVWRYTAGPSAGTDELRGADGSATTELEIRVQ
jgi:RHS repeat-associated protein